VVYESDEIPPFCPKGVLPTSVDFDIEYEETSYVDIAHKYIMFLNNIYE